jgi:hypothetical protein
MATYPFHPAVISVFERKWQALPRFQQTRGVLRLLALWVSRAYQEGFKGAHKDAMIGLGTAPLDDAMFRSATFEQLSEEMFIITKETAEAYLKTRVASPTHSDASNPAAPASPAVVPAVAVYLIPPPTASSANSGLTWTGEIPAQKWMNFYTKVLSKFATARGLKLTVKVEVAPEGGVSKQKQEETKSALRELGLNDDVRQN